MTTRVIEGSLVVPKGARFGIVASRFNHFIVDRLVEGALDALVRHGAQAQNVTVVRVPARGSCRSWRAGSRAPRSSTP